MTRRRILAFAPVWLGLVAMLVSVPGIGIPSKWSDEGATISAATRSLPDLWRMLQNIDVVHGAYYFAMHFWIEVFGTSALAIRVPSLLAIGVATAGVAVLGRQLDGPKLMIAGAAVFAVLPRVTWLAIEARSYAATATFVVWATVALVRAVRGGGVRFWIAYGLLAAAGTVLNIYVAFAVVAHAVTVLLWRRALSRRAVLAFAIVVVAAAAVAAPVVLLASRQIVQLTIGPFTLDYVSVMFGIEQFFTGATPTRDRAVPMPPTTIWAAAALALAVVGWLLLLWGAWTRRKSIGAVLIPAVFVPALLIIGYSALRTNMYTGRYLSFTAPAAALLIAAGVLALPRVWLRVVAVVLVVALAAPVYVFQRIPTGKQGTDWAAAGAIVAADRHKGDWVYWGQRFGGPKGASDARIGYTYPEDFAGLPSLTLALSPTKVASIWNVDRLLSQSAHQVDAATRIWVIGDHLGDPTFHRQRGAAFFERHGLHIAHTWPGVATDVTLWVRD
jgi:mannosyltransferase